MSGIPEKLKNVSHSLGDTLVARLKKIYDKSPVFIYAAVFGIIGVTTLLLTHAATQPSSFEAEDGALSGNASAVPDSSASGGTAVKFSSGTGAPGWTWSMSGIQGGGTAQVIATDPFNANGATVGGDSWGVYNTTNAGNDWLPAQKGLGTVNSTDLPLGDFFYMGLSYSHKFPGRVYALTGKLGDPTVGFFGYVSGDSVTVLTRSISGAEGTTCGARTERPRCTGNRVVTDYDSAAGIEYIYVATGNGNGVARSTDDGKTWKTIALNGVASGISGMALDPSDHNTLYVGTVGNKAYKLSSIRGTATSAQMSSAPTRVEEIAAIGSNVYMAGYTSGVFKLASDKTTWNQIGAGFFDSTAEWAAVGGAGNTLYVGGANTASGHSIGKSTDGGGTWNWVPSVKSNVNLTTWGTNVQWWLALAQPRTKLGCFDGGCTYESTSIAVDQFNPNIVYSAGRSGVWKSEDGGTTWRPSVNHLAGTMHEHIVVSSNGTVNVDDVDWTNLNSTDSFDTVTQSGAATNDTQKLKLTKAGHTYELVLSVPRDFKVDGVSVADEYFKAGTIRPHDIDVSPDGKTIYIAQYGGGVMIGRFQ